MTAAGCSLGGRHSSIGENGFALLLAPSASFAQQPSRVRVRGTVEAVDGPIMTVKSRDGTTYKVKLSYNAAVRGIIKAALSDIKDNSYIGVTGMPQADGSQKAVEIHIFPEPMRNRRGSSALGPGAQQHHDQRDRGANGERGAGQRDHAQIQRRRKEDYRRARGGDRDLRSG